MAVDLEARVHQSVFSLPYIHRDEEDAIRSHLRAKRPVLLIGSSMVGKTKMAARVIADEFSSWPVAIPDSKTALSDLEANDVSLHDSVVWLDDIDRLIGAGGITDGALQRLAAAGNVIVGTIRAKAYDQFRPSDQMRPPEWDVLCLFEHVFVNRNMTEKEQVQLVTVVLDPDIRERILTVGLGEYVGAAGQVAEALKLGASGTNPVGYALVLGASDWRRCGISRPIPLQTLVGLAGPHIGQRGQVQLADEDAFNEGMTWATRDINPNVALIQRDGIDSYAVYDYALDVISEQAGPIPKSNWALVIANAEIPELIRVGYNAEVIYHQSEIATEAWRKASDCGDAKAAVNLGLLLANQGDIEGAKDAYQRAIDSGHADVIPRAIGNLGNLLASQKDIEGAKDAYQRAIDSGHADEAPWAMVNLGNLLASQKDIEGAKDAYQRAIDSGHADEAPRAMVDLGVLLADQGDMQGTKDAYQRAIDSGHADKAPRAMVNLGNLLSDQKHIEGARDAYQLAIDSGHTEMAPLASANLGIMLARQRDIEGAKDAYQRAIDSGQSHAAPIAAVNLAILLDVFQGDAQGAEDAYQKAIDSGHTDMAPRAAESLGRLLARRKDLEGAKEAYQKAIDSGHASTASMAAVSLGQLLANQGDVQGAKGAYQKAIDFGNADMVPMAAWHLGKLLADIGDLQGARDAYQQAIDSQHAFYASLAGSSLKLLLLRQQLWERHGSD